MPFDNWGTDRFREAVLLVQGAAFDTDHLCGRSIHESVS